MKPMILIACLLVLAACGADGDPQPPTASGLTISGDARIGIVSE
jgi:hypothetical protein